MAQTATGEDVFSESPFFFNRLNHVLFGWYPRPLVERNGAYSMRQYYSPSGDHIRMGYVGDNLGATKGVIPIEHHIVMLNPDVAWRTAGNSCGYIELAVTPGSCEKVVERALAFVEDESLSKEWGIAVKHGFYIDPSFRFYGRQAREELVSRDSAVEIAQNQGIMLHGGRGVIGALAAIALSGLPNEILLSPERKVPVQSSVTRKQP